MDTPDAVQKEGEKRKSMYSAMDTLGAVQKEGQERSIRVQCNGHTWCC